MPEATVDLTSSLAPLLLVLAIAGLTWSLVRIARLRRSMAALAMDARDVAQGNARQPLALDADARVTDLRAALTEMAQALGADIAVAEAEHAQLAAILETMADGVIVLNALGSVVVLNDAAAELVGA